MHPMPLRVFGRTFTWRSQARATWFTPVAVLLLISISNGEAINLQKGDPDVVPWVSVLIILVTMVGAAGFAWPTSPPATRTGAGCSRSSG